MSPFRSSTVLAALVLGSATFALSLSHAEKAADLQLASGSLGKPAFEETFDTPSLAAAWSVKKGDWQVQDGSLVGKEKKEDNHPAVLFLDKPLHDSTIRFSFKLDGSKGLALSYNTGKGHLFRCSFNAKGVVINRDRDKNDAASKASEMAKATTTFNKGSWYTVLVSIEGNKVTLRTDNGVQLEATDPALNVEKTGFRFVTTGESVALDDVKVWQKPS